MKKTSKAVTTSPLDPKNVAKDMKELKKMYEHTCSILVIILIMVTDKD